MDRPAAPIDTAVLETIRDRLRTHSLVDSVRMEQTDGPISQLVVAIDPDRYPDHVNEARLEIQWFRNEDYNFHYIETHRSGGVWQCRWDRHPNPHAARTHFHPPPEGRSNAAVDDQPENRQPTPMVTRTLANIRERIDQHWA